MHFFKRIHGPPMKVKIHEENVPKTILDHNTLYRIKTETDLSGTKIVKIARLLKNNLDVKVEPYFKEALVEKGKELEEFFETKILDMEVYDVEDFQLWRFSEEG